MLGLSMPMVTHLARERGVGRKIGRDWLFTRSDIEAIRNREDLRTKKPAPPKEEPARNP